MISHQHQCIFIHIPKCAGTSIESALGHLDNHSGRGGQDHRSIRMIEQPYLTQNLFCSKENLVEVFQRQKYQYLYKAHNYKKKITVTKQQYNSYFEFAVVRNPWARAFSLYKNVMRDEIHLKNFGITVEMPFKEFLIQFAGKGMLRAQLYWIKGFDGSIPLDYIGRFENLSNDMNAIFKRLNLSNITLPHKIKSTKDDYREYYDDETIDIILDICREDIDIFDYSFDSK